MIAIVTIGDEVLYGFTPNSNASFISQFLILNGLIPRLVTTIGDDRAMMASTIQKLLQQGVTVITTGGLGPTCDDFTKSVAASLFSKKCIHNPECEKELKAQYGASLPTLIDQSTWPENARLFSNPNGTAFGFCLEDEKLFGKAKLICLPGPPLEMRPMLDRYVLPLLPKCAEEIFLQLHLCGIPEHEVDPYLRELQKSYPSLQFGIYPSYGTLSVHIRAQKGIKLEAEEAYNKIKQKFSTLVFQGDRGGIEEAVLQLLGDKKLTLSFAESCTGGALSSRITAIPGASKVFLGSVVSYSNSVKETLLSVDAETIEKFGAVSQETTEKMARGCLQKFQSDVAIAVSGIFGPTGGTKEKPVGTVCYTIVHNKVFHSGTKHFSGERLTIREKVVQFLLIECYNLVQGNR